MRQVSESVSPDMTIFVMDSSIGQAALDQARAFKQTVDVGSVVVTKLDGHAAGGAAIASPMRRDQGLRPVHAARASTSTSSSRSAPSCSSRDCSGLGDWTAFIDKISGERRRSPSCGEGTLAEGADAILYEQFANIQRNAPCRA